MKKQTHDLVGHSASVGASRLGAWSATGMGMATSTIDAVAVTQYHTGIFIDANPGTRRQEGTSP